MSKILLSFVIPCYRGQDTVSTVIESIISMVSDRRDYDYEIIAVNDCSPDDELKVLMEWADRNSRIKIVDLTKNVGKHSAMLAGYSYIRGDYVVNVDDDLQSPVANLWDLLDPIIRDECDVTTAEYDRKRESFFRRTASRLNVIISSLFIKRPKGIRFENISVLNRITANEVIKYRNPFPYFPGLVFRVTDRIKLIPMKQELRGDNKRSGFTFKKSLSLFVNELTSFSVRPLRIALVFGLLFVIASFAMIIIIIARKLAYPETEVGWSSIMTMLLFTNGIMMLIIGVVGEYVGRIFICINSAPQYVVKRTVNIS